jgi:O-antigen ligase
LHMPDSPHKVPDDGIRKHAVTLIALSIALITLLLDGGTSPSTVIAASSILLVACLWNVRTADTSAKPGVILALLMLFGMLTVIPMPDGILKIAGKEAAGHHELARAALEESHDQGLITSSPGFFQISRNRAGTLRALLLLSLVICAGSISRRIPQNRRVAVLLCLGLVAAVIGIAGMASLHKISQGKSFWWFFPVAHGRPVACFINRNHFGGFLAVMASVLFGLSCRLFGEKKRLLGFASSTAFLICALSVLGSFSRGALLALLCGLLVAIIINLRKHPLATALLMLLLIAGGYAALSTGEHQAPIRSRMVTLLKPTETTSAKLRIDTWRDTLLIWKRYPVFGTGLNGFRSVYPQHKTTSTRKEPKNVENEYIQMPVELGLIGSALLAAALIVFAMPCIHSKKSETSLVSIIMPGLVVAAAHCFVDFAIRIPVYSFVIAILLGFCTLDRHCTARRSRAPALLFLSSMTILLIIACLTHGRILLLDSPDHLNKAEPDELSQALISSPSYWHAYYNLGRLAAHDPAMRDLAETHISTASQLDPKNYRMLIELARLRLDMGQTDKAIEAYAKAKKLRAWLNVQELESLLKQRKQ